MNDAAAQIESEATAPAPSRAVRIWTWISWALGVVGAFNLIAHAQNLVQLSASIHKLVGWWHYGVALLFWFLRIDLPLVVREALVLLGLAISAANLAMYGRYGITMIGIVRSFLFSYPETPARVERAARRDRVVKSLEGTQRYYFLAALVLLVGLIGVLCVHFPLLGVYLLAAAATLALGLWLLVKKVGVDLPVPVKSVAFIVFYLFCTPLMVVFMVASVTAIFHRQIAITAGAVVLLLALNLAFVHFVDPFAPLLSDLPEAPAPASLE